MTDNDPPRALPSVGDEIRVDHGVMRDVCDKLKRDLRGLESGDRGTPLHFRTNENALLSGAELGRYPAAEGSSGQDGLAATCKNAFTEIQETYDSFLEAYDGVVEKLNKTAQNHGDAERANEGNAGRAHT